MKTIIFISFFLLLFTALVSAEEKTKYKCTYETTVVTDTVTRKSFPKDTYIVQIGDNITKGFYYKKFYVDSIKNSNIALYDQMVNNAHDVLFKLLQQGDPKAFEKANAIRNMPSSFGKLILFKDYKKNQIIVIDEITMIGQFTFTEELSPQNWEIESDTMTILGYHSQKATCRYRGRNWIAWFTNEIPLSEGPWKFSGLPGLITKVEDDKGHYNFTLTGFQEIEEPLEIDIPKNAEKTTREKFIKIWRSEKENKSARNFVLESNNINKPNSKNTEDTSLSYDYIETDYKEWGKEK